MTALDEVALPFWIGGYEGAEHVNATGDVLDMARDNGHLARGRRPVARAANACARWRLAAAA